LSHILIFLSTHPLLLFRLGRPDSQ
jgi:hypothetical protein